jgi:hypothetical protein
MKMKPLGDSVGGCRIVELTLPMAQGRGLRRDEFGMHDRPHITPANTIRTRERSSRRVSPASGMSRSAVGPESLTTEHTEHTEKKPGIGIVCPYSLPCGPCGPWFKSAFRIRTDGEDRGCRGNSAVGPVNPVAGTGARVLGSGPWPLSPESTSGKPPWDVLGAVWSQGRGSLWWGERPKMRGFGESEVRRKVEETRRGGRGNGEELAYGNSRRRLRRP